MDRAKRETIKVHPSLQIMVFVILTYGLTSRFGMRTERGCSDPSFR